MTGKRPQIFVLSLLLGSLALSANEEVIHCHADAPETTQWAARELQRLVLRSTGRDKAVSATPTASPWMRLVSDETLPHDGFEIRAEGGGFVLAGNDTVPAGLWAVPSHGTL